MPYIADMDRARSLEGTLVGNGQCVTLVQAVASIPSTSQWHQGGLVKGSGRITPGTVIATFDPNGEYGSRMDGTSHAAIYLRQDAAGIWVLDQWHGKTTQPVLERLIRFKGGMGSKVNDGDQYYVVQ